MPLHGGRDGVGDFRQARNIRAQLGFFPWLADLLVDQAIHGRRPAPVKQRLHAVNRVQRRVGRERDQVNRQDWLAVCKSVGDHFAQSRERLLLGARDVEHVFVDETLAGERAGEGNHRFRDVAARVHGCIQQHGADAGEQAFEPAVTDRR